MDVFFYSLQEVETEQYYTLFLETLKQRGYDGYFCPKSRAKLVSEQERKHVDGCAVFFKTEKCVSEDFFFVSSKGVTVSKYLPISIGLLWSRNTLWSSIRLPWRTPRAQRSC